MLKVVGIFQVFFNCYRLKVICMKKLVIFLKAVRMFLIVWVVLSYTTTS